MKMKLLFLSVILSIVAVSQAQSRKIHYIHWNRANPMFRLDNTDHIIDVNAGNLPWEYDQANIICPVSKADTKMPESHVIYSVSREEFESCRITNPKPKIVAVCSKPHQLLYFTITFRSFSPTPGGLEFHPGQDYYFISTSSPEDLHRRVGGGCSTHNMKMIFKVSDDNKLKHQQLNAPRTHPNAEHEIDSNEISFHQRNEINSYDAPTTTTTTTTTVKPIISFNSKDPKSRRGDYIYYYHPRDLIDLQETNNGLESNDKYSDDWRKQALKFTSAAHSISTFSLHTIFASILLLSFCR